MEVNKAQHRNLLYIDPRSLEIEEGFNTRIDYGNIEELRDSIIENGVKIPLRGCRKKGHDKYIIMDGHRRHRAVMMAIKEGHNIARIPFLLEEKKSREERLFELLLSNDGKPLTSLELGETYKRLKNYGYNATEISKKVGKSITHVIDMIGVADSEKEVKDSINKGIISATLVSETKKKFDDKQEADKAILKAIKEKTGKGKVIRKDLTKVVKNEKKPKEHRKYSDKRIFTEKEVAELLEKQIRECAKQIVPAFRSKILNTPLVI